MPICSTNRRSVLLWMFVTIAAAFFWWLPKFQASGNPFDESVLLVYPELCLDGKIVHRDFQSFYGPGNIWMLAGLYHCFGISISVERATALAERIVLLFLLGYMALRIERKSAGIVWLAGLFVLTPLALLALAWIPAVTFALAGLIVAAETGRNGRKDTTAIWSGILLACSLTFRPDLGPAVILGSGVFLAFWSGSKRLKWLVGFAIGLLPMLWHVYEATPLAVWNNLVYFPVHIVRDARSIPWANVDPEVRRLAWLFLVLTGANIVTAIVQWRRSAVDQKPVLYLSASLLGAGLAPQIFQRCDLAHVAMGSLLSYPLAATTVQFWLEPWLRRRSALLQSLVGGVVCTLILIATAPLYFKNGVLVEIREAVTQNHPPVSWVSNGNRSYPISPPAAQFYSTQVVEYIQRESRQGDRLFVGPGDLRRTLYNDIYLYHLLMPRVVPGSFYVELNPLLANAEDSGLDQQIALCQWVVLNRIYDHYREANRSSEFGSTKPVEVLQTQFELVLERGPFLVYRHR